MCDSVVNDENGKPFKVHLCKTDISQNSNKFYDMELLQKSKNRYAVKLINGRIGYKGCTNFKEFGDLSKAKDFFCKKFKEKTHLEWEERDDEPMPGRYVVVELVNEKQVKKEENVEVKEEPKEEEEEEEKPVKQKRGRAKKEPKKEENEESCGISEKVRDMLKCICDEDVHLGMLKQLKYNEKYGKPLDCLSLAQIATGYQILCDIENSIVESTAGTSKRGRKKSAPTTIGRSSTHDTNKYYSLIPHSFGFSVPPKIDTLSKIQQERDLLDALKGTIEAAQSMKDLKSTKSSKDIYDRLYEQLPCKIEPVEPNIAKLIEECLQLRAPTHLHAMNLVEAFEIVHEQGEVVPAKRRRRRAENHKLLLWHGTRVTNVFSILMNGLLIPEGPRGDLMFGNGVYFANIPSKSANYCKPDDTSRIFMLLCEVDTENPLVLRESEVAAPDMVKSQKKGLVYAAGRQTPKEKIEIDGVPIFKGKLEDVEGESELLYDEYVVFEREKFKIKYVVEVKLRELTMDEMMDL